MKRFAFATAFAMVGCGAVFGIPSDVQEQAGGDASADANATEAATVVVTDAVAPDAAPSEASTGGACSPRDPFGGPVALAELGGPNDGVADARLSEDELTIFFASKPAGGESWDLFTAKRVDRNAKFGTPTRLAGAINDKAQDERSPSPTADGKTLFFVRGATLFASTFDAAVGFDAGVQIKTNSTHDQVRDVFVRADLPTELWFGAGTTGLPDSFDLIMGKRATGDVFVTSDPASNINQDGKDDFAPVISEDGLALYFAKARQEGTGDKGDWDVWMATRPTRDGTFGAPDQLEPLAGQNVIDTAPTWISADNCRLYMWREFGKNPASDTVMVASRAH